MEVRRVGIVLEFHIVGGPISGSRLDLLLF